MRRFGLSLGIIVAALGLVLPAALAANPQVNHFEFSNTFSDNDFCGTGMTIDISVAGHGTEFLAPNQPVDYRNTVNGTTIYTNPLTGDTVIEHFAGPASEKTISGDPEGLHVQEVIVKGLPDLIRAEHGGVLLRDAGYVVLHQTFDGDEFLSSETIVNRGPHPILDSDFALFCEVMPDALGLS